MTRYASAFFYLTYLLQLAHQALVATVTSSGLGLRKGLGLSLGVGLGVGSGVCLGVAKTME
jgi:hypothetical protein